LGALLKAMKRIVWKRVAWFGVEVPPPERIVPLLIDVDRFLAANWGEGFAVAVEEKRAERFAELAELRGWRVRRVDPP